MSSRSAKEDAEAAEQEEEDEAAADEDAADALLLAPPVDGGDARIIGEWTRVPAREARRAGLARAAV